MTAELKQTCQSCPAQWEGRTASGYPLYVRYRFSILSVYLGEKDSTVAIDDWLDPKHLIFQRRISEEEFDGTIEWDEVIRHAGNLLDL